MCNKNNGFTLIETLVAVIVLSISLVVIMQLISTNLKSLPQSENQLKAVYLARAKMEEELLSNQFAPGTTSASFDDTFSWEMNITKQEPEKAGGDLNETEQEKSQSTVEIFKIDLAIKWYNGDKEKSYSISTLKSFVR